MKSFVLPTNPPRPSPEAQQCALLLPDILPRILRSVRFAIAHLHDSPLTFPQFRTLHFLHARSGTNLSATAEFLGLSLPSTSKLVDHLVRLALLTRDNDISDRRKMTLRLTPKGDALLKNAQDSIQQLLAGTLARYNAEELATLHQALAMLQQSFPSPLTDGHSPFLPGSPDFQHRPPAPPRAAIS